MKIRPTRLPYEIEYYIDAESTNRNITGGAYTALALYGEIDILRSITGITAGDRNGRRMTDEDIAKLAQEIAERIAHGETRTIGHYQMLREKEKISQALETYAVEIVKQLPAHRAAVIRQESALTLLEERVATFEYLIEWRFTDYITGGCMGGFHPTHLTGKGKIWKLDAKRLRSPGKIRRYVRSDPHIHHTGQLFKINTGVECAIVRPSQDDIEELHADFEQQMRGFRDEHAQEWASLGVDYADVTGPVVRLKPGFHAKQRRQRRERQSIMKRSANLALRILGEEKTRAFVKGLPIEVEGPEFIFKLERRARLFDKGHGTLNINILSKTRRKMASLCMYQETPPLDQASSIALFCAVGEDRQVIQDGNVFNITPEIHNNEFLVSVSRDAAEQERRLNRVDAELVVRQAVEEENRQIALDRRHQFRKIKQYDPLMREMTKNHQKDVGHLYWRALDEVLFTMRGLQIPPMFKPTWEPGGFDYDRGLNWMSTLFNPDLVGAVQARRVAA